MQDVYINDVGIYLPNKPVHNDDIESILGMVGNRPSKARKIVLRNNGIKKRYYAIDPVSGKPTHTNKEMTIAAIQSMARDGRNLNDIECLVCGTSSPDQLLPSHAVMVHGEAGIPTCEVASFTGICASGIQSLKYSYLSVLSGQCNHAVCTGSEIASGAMRSEQFQDEIDFRIEALEKNPSLAFGKDFLRWMLSDGAGAAWLQNKPNKSSLSLKIEWVDIQSFANELDVCMYQGGVKQDNGSLKGYRNYTPESGSHQSILSLEQDVKLLNEHIIDTSVRALSASVTKHTLDLNDIDYFLPHLSSEYFKTRLYEGYLAQGHYIDMSKWFTNLADVGNVGSASIYLMLEELFHSGQLKHGQKILLMVPESGRFTMSFTLLTVVA
ncbi:MAG: beta-ketoacyl-ACP synthase III [Mariprofundales bacterium]